MSALVDARQLFTLVIVNKEDMQRDLLAVEIESGSERERNRALEEDNDLRGRTGDYVLLYED